MTRGDRTRLPRRSLSGSPALALGPRAAAPASDCGHAAKAQCSGGAEAAKSVPRRAHGTSLEAGRGDSACSPHTGSAHLPLARSRHYRLRGTAISALLTGTAAKGPLQAPAPPAQEVEARPRPSPAPRPTQPPGLASRRPPAPRALSSPSPERRARPEVLRSSRTMAVTLDVALQAAPAPGLAPRTLTPFRPPRTFLKRLQFRPEPSSPEPSSPTPLLLRPLPRPVLADSLPQGS
ncbi:nematocyst expressed protein 3-like [Penaeus vannamei]|uniref:nematocyst expressed protein 3-like n=1 Tax=Penaeus vannamei TaxID=6689 RepID=UPI00387F77E4